MKQDLRHKALIISLNISQWSGRKFDRKATNEVNENHKTQNAGRFNKILVDQAAIKTIASASAKVRAAHTKMTLPWGNNGDRLLPSVKFMDYMTELNGFLMEFNQSVNDFLSGYVESIDEARTRLKDLYNPYDYPSEAEMKAKFGYKLDYQPLPSLDDFRLQMTGANAVHENLEQSTNNRHKAAIQEISNRAKDAIGRIKGAIDRLETKDNAKFYNSLIETVTDLAEAIPSLNYTGDEGAYKLAKGLKSLTIEPSSIKEDKDVRTAYKKRLDRVNSLCW
jgi:hypothetical protein